MKFTLEYDATTGIYMASALLDKAEREEELADELETQAEASSHGLRYLLELKALQARNRAKLLREAGTAIKRDVHNALVADFGKALDAAEGK